MKKFGLILFIFFSLFLLSCKNNEEEVIDKPDEKEEQRIEDSVNLNSNDIVLALDKTYKLDISLTGEPSYSFSYDEKIIRVLDDVIIPNNAGATTLSLIYNNEIIKSINVIIFEKPNEIVFIDFVDSVKVGTEVELKVNINDYVIELSNDNLTYDKDSKTLKAIKAGKTEITLKYLYDESLFIKKEITVKEQFEKASFIYVNNNVSAKNGEEVEVDGYIFTFGENLFNTIEDALDYEDDIVVGSTDEETLQITSSNVSISGFSESTPLDIRITIASGVKGITIKNLTFTKESKIILVGNNSNILITGNTFIDTIESTKTWASDNKYTYGLIELTNTSLYHHDITISNNTFTNIGECGINISTTHNITIEGNTFNGFKRDAIRFNNGIIKEECVWSISNNKFIDGTYSALYFRTYGSGVDSIYHYVDIKDNYISSCGKIDEEYSAAIVFRNYQEGGACVDISYNTFHACSKYIFLRNNAKKANQTNFAGYVVGNVFETIPSKYYFNNLNSSDSFTNNPKQTKLLNNAYLDDGKDIKPNEALFIGNYNNTTLTLSRVNKLYHFSLHHVMQVGKSVKLVDDVEATENGTFKISSLTIEALDSGIFYLKHNDDSFEVKCVKNIELVVRFINVALGEIGYEEMDEYGNTGTSGNYTKYGAWYGINPGAWCAMYVSWCANEAGVPTSIIPKYASVQIGMDWYKNKGLFQYKENYTPKAGDIMFMKSNGASHTGIVLYCDGTTLYTVEGNTSDKCALRKYNVGNAKITGYGTPEWPYYSPDGYNFSSGEAQDGSGHSTT